MGRWAVIDKSNKVINVVEWDGKSNWKPPEGCVLIESEIADRDDEYVNDQFIKSGII